MTWNNISTLGTDLNIDFETLNDIIENLVHLKSIIPDVYFLNGKSYRANSESGAQMKIQTSCTSIASVTGKQSFWIPFASTHNGKYTPTVVATAFSNYTMYCQVTKVQSNGFYVTLTPTSKKKITGVKVNWIAITQLGS
jgi:hypothetical protein